MVEDWEMYNVDDCFVCLRVWSQAIAKGRSLP